MKSIGSDWYRKIWSLDIMEMSWVEDTKRQVDFLVDCLELKGGERILDLACGFGRHSIALAERGFSVVGVDITRDYIAFADQTAKEKHLDVEFILADLRDLSFTEEFDAVINMGDGAIGYLENDEENLKIFDVVARALRPGGKHFMDIMNGDYAEHHFPCQLWDAGEKCLTLSRFEWDSETRTMLYGQADYLYGQVLEKPEIDRGNPTRLYTLSELAIILHKRGMAVQDSFSDFTGKASSADGIQLLVSSRKCG